MHQIYVPVAGFGWDVTALRGPPPLLRLLRGDFQSTFRAMAASFPPPSLALGQPLLDEPTFRRALYRATLGLGASLGAAVLALLAVTLFLLRAAAWVEHTDQVIAQASRVERLAREMERSARNFQMVAEPEFLRPWDDARERLGPAFGALSAAVSDNPSQIAAAAVWRKRFAQWEAHAAETLTGAGAEVEVRSGAWLARDRALFEDAREAGAQFVATEESLRDWRAHALALLRSVLLGGLLLGLVVGVPLLVRTLRRTLRRLDDAYRGNFAAMRDQRDQLHVSMRSIGDAVLATDPAGAVVFLNLVAERLTGWTTEEAHGRPLREVLPIYNEETGAETENPVERVLRERVVVGLANHTVLRPRGGGEIPIEDSAAPILHADGSVRGVILVFRDVTEKHAQERAMRRAEAGLRAGEARARAILDTAFEVVLLMDARGRIMDWNPAAERMFGWSREEVLGAELAPHIIPERLRAAHARGLAHYLATGEGPVLGRRLELPAVRRDGAEFPVELSINRLPGTEPPEFVGFVRDIAQRKAAEAELAERVRLASLRAEVAALLASRMDTAASLHGCCELLVHHLEAAFARVWTLDPEEPVLVLRASAGLYTHLDGPHARVPVGQYKIGRIAQSRRAHLTNDVPHDPNVSDQEWARREGMIAFAGYPLIADGRMLGVLALFSRQALTEAVLGDLAPIADAVAASIERRAAEASLVAEKERAEIASRAKDNFMAALSHELRTPLTPVLMSAAAMRDDERLPADARAELGMIERNIALEARLIDDLLDLTRIVKGKLQLREEACDAHSLIGLAVEIVRNEAQTKPVTLELELAARRTGLHGDPARLQQVIWNLLRNAIKFTPVGGRVCIRTRDETDERLRIEISDTGIGLAPEAMETIFRPFEQAGRENDHRFGGLGLGLAIARAIVDLHGGVIRAESAGPGRGATFIIELPGAREQETGVTSAAGGAAAPGGTGGTVPDEGPPLHLLVVEDHEATVAVLRRLLTRAGHHVVTANSVASALAAAGAAPFDGVISDLGLPDGTGQELMARLLVLQPRLRGIALSGYGMEEDLRRSGEAGFFTHLVKPVDFDQLRRALRELAAHLPQR